MQWQKSVVSLDCHYKQSLLYYNNNLGKQMQKSSIHKNKWLVCISLLILFTMQISAVVHANEHLLNTSETKCILHLEAEQFSNLLATKNLVFVQKQQIVKPYIQHKGLNSNPLLINYLSRAPPRL